MLKAQEITKRIPFLPSRTQLSQYNSALFMEITGKYDEYVPL
jgi:hypothetical protein